MKNKIRIRDTCPYCHDKDFTTFFIISCVIIAAIFGGIVGHILK